MAPPGRIELPTRVRQTRVIASSPRGGIAPGCYWADPSQFGPTQGTPLLLSWAAPQPWPLGGWSDGPQAVWSRQPETMSVAGALGLEPRSADLESAVLPVKLYTYFVFSLFRANKKPPRGQASREGVCQPAAGLRPGISPRTVQTYFQTGCCLNDAGLRHGGHLLLAPCRDNVPSVSPILSFRIRLSRGFSFVARKNSYMCSMILLTIGFSSSNPTKSNGTPCLSSIDFILLSMSMAASASSYLPSRLYESSLRSTKKLSAGY